MKLTAVSYKKILSFESFNDLKKVESIYICSLKNKNEAGSKEPKYTSQLMHCQKNQRGKEFKEGQIKTFTTTNIRVTM